MTFFKFLTYKILYSPFQLLSEVFLIFRVKQGSYILRVRMWRSYRKQSDTIIHVTSEFRFSICLFSIPITLMFLEMALYSFAKMSKPTVKLIIGTLLNFKCYSTKLLLYVEQDPQLWLGTQWGSFCPGLLPSQNKIHQSMKLLCKSWLWERHARPFALP